MNVDTGSNYQDLTRHALSRLVLSLALTLGFVVFEALAGIFANSLALLTDAAHNFTDVIALALTWYALRLTTLPASGRKTYGNHRAGILVALINSTTLAVISIGIFYEAYQRLISPPEVKSSVLITVGLIAFIVNLVTAWLIKQGSEKDLNLRSAFVHLMGDVLSTLAAVVAGVLIAVTHLNWLDPLVSIFIGLLILWNAVGILRETVNILLENTPHDINMEQMFNDLMRVDGVRGVHDLHVWSITQNLRAMSAHVLTDDVPISSGAAIQREINDVLLRRYRISHATIQLECEGCESLLLYCDLNGSADLIERSSTSSTR